MDEHTLRGTFHVMDAMEAERKAEETAEAYFGRIPFLIDLRVDEIRTMGGQVLGYEVSYTATADSVRER